MTGLPAWTVPGQHRPDRFVTLVVAADHLESGGDVLGLDVDPELLRDLPSAIEARRRGIGIGQEESEDPRGTQGEGRKGAANRAVDAPGEGDDHTPAAQRSPDDLPDGGGDSLGFPWAVDLEERLPECAG